MKRTVGLCQNIVVAVVTTNRAARPPVRLSVACFGAVRWAAPLYVLAHTVVEQQQKVQNRNGKSAQTLSASGALLIVRCY